MSTEKKTKAVFDTNVLVSSALSDGISAEILKLAENKEFLSVTSPDIVEELRDVLTRDRLPFAEEQVDELVSKILSISQVIDSQIELEVIEDDPISCYIHNYLFKFLVLNMPIPFHHCYLIQSPLLSVCSV